MRVVLKLRRALRQMMGFVMQAVHRQELLAYAPAPVVAWENLIVLRFLYSPFAYKKL